MFDQLLSPEGGILSGIVMRGFAHWHENQKRRQELEDGNLETSKAVGATGTEYGKTSGMFHWIKRSIVLSFMVSFFALTYFMLFEPTLVSSAMKKYGKVFFFGGHYGILHSFLEVHLFVMLTSVSYYLSGVVTGRGLIR